MTIKGIPMTIEEISDDKRSIDDYDEKHVKREEGDDEEE